MTTCIRAAMTSIAVGLLCWTSYVAGAETPPVQVTLAHGNLAQLPIVVSARASDARRQVAAELADYLRRMTGAAFEVTAGDGTRGIVLGTLDEFPNPTLSPRLEIRNTYDGKEAFVIRTEADRLLLIGNTDVGVSHAAFRLLEHLGCRWFFPAKEWEIVPVHTTLTVAIDEADRPALLARRIWWGYGFFDWDRGLKEYQAWARHNRMAASMTVSCGHAWQTILDENRQTFDAHPEFLALVKDKRQGPQFCVSRPEVRKLAIEHALGHFEKHPESDMVSLETSDGNGHCECPECLRMGSISERVFGLANEAARVVAAKYPGKIRATNRWSANTCWRWLRATWTRPHGWRRIGLTSAPGWII
ncbi:MAG: DUF4838 domain-containing protein [Planctomycetota bacterium]|nr:DUF4838 domain-containing protein [Planctomycetota bacterium]